MSKESGWTKLFSFLDTSSKSEMDEYDNPPIYFTSQGERYIYPDDLMRSKNAQNIINKFKAFAKAQNLEPAQGLGPPSSEDSTQQK